MNPNNCSNRNHSRSNPMVRICPNCGEILNPSIAAKECSEEDHGIKRKRRNVYCYDCGKKLIG